jgi:hypothetical protein
MDYELWTEIGDLEMAFIDHSFNHLLDALSLLNPRFEFPSVSFDTVDAHSADITIRLTLKPCTKENFNELKETHILDKADLGYCRGIARQADESLESVGEENQAFDD